MMREMTLIESVISFLYYALKKLHVVYAKLVAGAESHQPAQMELQLKVTSLLT
ncbi:hypothetical protein KP77_13620 [Jeotgalibacillus alimentarius]|uniref:Uncharacterized protein n=1 Tax=Jeotgalibacillus alimentarius TaxID=135826 RepID=A0A0C2VPB1_9BACL|nr:hypothetical protein KP77_13620 [Jeotgalibacillus alimentarius]